MSSWISGASPNEHDGDITFKAGRANVRAFIPKVLDLVRGGKLRPERITTCLAAWDDAAEALGDRSTKVVISRSLGELRQEA